jgi:hypothetical protein
MPAAFCVLRKERIDMGIADIFKKAKASAEDVVEKRGGTDALKKDAEELKDIAKSKGSMKDKARAAADALKEPGAPGSTEPGAPASKEPRAPGSPEPGAPASKEPGAPGGK